MIIQSARAAAGHLFSPPFRGIFLKSVAVTLVLLVGAWFGLAWLVDRFAIGFIEDWFDFSPQAGGWVGLFAAVVAGLGLAVGLALLVGPVTAIVAGLFLDDVAELVEKQDFPDDPPGRPMPPLRSLILSVRFFGIVVLGNLIALALLLVPFVNVAAFFVVNGYLLGREFFEFAAMRLRSEEEARAMRRANSGTVFAAGLLIAAFLAVPLLNLLTPLFGATMMVHLHKRLSAS